jgi:hypothetical protein
MLQFCNTVFAGNYLVNGTITPPEGNNINYNSSGYAQTVDLPDSVPDINFMSMSQNVNDNISQYNNPQNNSVTQSSVHTLGLGPATAAVNAYLGQAQSQSILFANMVNQQAQYAEIASTTLGQELSQLFSIGDSQ